MLQWRGPCAGSGRRVGTDPHPGSHPICPLTHAPAPGLARQPAVALQAVTHQAGRLAQVFLIRAPWGALHPGGCLQEGLMRNCLQMLSCKQDVKKGRAGAALGCRQAGLWRGAWPVLPPPPPFFLAETGRLRRPGQAWAHGQGW